MGSFDITIAQKLAVAVALPVASFLLYFLLKKSHEEEEETGPRVVTSRQTLIEVKVPRSAAGTIIGPRGARIKELQESTGTRIQFKDDAGSDNAERTVVIRGQVEAAQRAEMIIRHMVAEIPPIVKDSINVPERAVGRIIGRGGETIRSLCRSSKCKINVPQEQKLGGIQRIILEGSPTAISTAKALIEEKLDEEETFRARIAVNASNRQERGPRRREGGTEYTRQEAAQLLQAEEEDDRWDAQPKSEPARTDDVVDATPSPATIAPEAAKWSNHREYLEVYVSAVEHPGHFWVQVISSKATKLDDLSQDMTRFYSHMHEGEAATVGEIHEDDLLAAPFPFDDQWYRVRVIEVQDDKVDAYYVDFGDSYWVEKSKLKSLRSDFLSLPFQAIEVCLANVRPNGDTWSEDANTLFEELTHTAKWKVINARTVSYAKTNDGESMPCVELIDTNGVKDVNVAKVLIEKEFAEYVQDKEADTSSDVSSNTQIDDSIPYEEIASESENKLMSSVDPHFSSPSYCRKRRPHRNSQQLVSSSEEKGDLFAEKGLVDTVSPSDVSHDLCVDTSRVEMKVPFDDTSPCVHVEPFDQRLLQATFLEEDFVSDLEVFYDAKEDQVIERSKCTLNSYCPFDISEHATVKTAGVTEFSEGDVYLNTVKMEHEDSPTALLETSIQLIQTQHENSENKTVQNTNELLVCEAKGQLAIRPKTLDVDTQEDISIKLPLHNSEMAAKQLYQSSPSSKEEYLTGLSKSCYTTAEQNVSFHGPCDVTDNSTYNMKAVLSDVCVEVPPMVNMGTKDDEYAPESVSAVYKCSQKPTNSCVSTDRRDICLDNVEESIDTSCKYGNKEDISKKSDFGNVFSFDESDVNSDINTQGCLLDPGDEFSIRYAEGTEVGAKVGCEVREHSIAADYNTVFGADQLMPYDECSSHSKTADSQSDQVSSTADIQSPISYYEEKCVESERKISETTKVGVQLNNYGGCFAEDVYVSLHAVGGPSSPRPLDLADRPLLDSSSLLVLGRQCEDADETNVGHLLEEMCPIQDKPEDGSVIDQSAPITSIESDKSDTASTREVRSVDCSNDGEHTSGDTLSTESSEISILNPTTCLSRDEGQNLSIGDMSEVCPPQDTDLSSAKLASIPAYDTQYVKELISSPQANSEHSPYETHVSEVSVDRQFALLEKETDVLVENLAVEACTPDDTDIAIAEQSSISESQSLHVKEKAVLSPQGHSSNCFGQNRNVSDDMKSALVDKDTDILVENTLLDTESKGSHITGECPNEGPSDVNCEPKSTLMASSSELKTLDLKVDDVIVPGLQRQQHETPSSSAESFNMPFQDTRHAQPDAVYSTENPSVGGPPGDLTLTLSFDIKAEQSDSAVTRDVQEVENSDDLINLPVDALFEFPISNTTTLLSLDEEQDLSISDISEACTLEEADLSRAEMTSFPECETQHVKEEQGISSQQDSSSNCSDQSPVPFEHLTSHKDRDHFNNSLVEKETDMSVEKVDVELSHRKCSETDMPVQCPNEELNDVKHEPNNTLMMSSSELQTIDLKVEDVLVPGLQSQQHEIPSSSAESFDTPFQDTHDAQPDAIHSTENPSVEGPLGDLTLTLSFDIKTEQSGSAFTKDVQEVEYSDDIINLPVEACTLEETELSSAEQTSVNECEIQHVKEEQVISFQQDGSDNCSDQSPVTLEHLTSYEDDKSLVEKETDMLVEKGDVELLHGEGSETVQCQCPNEELKDVHCDQNDTRMMLSSESKNVELEKTKGVLSQIPDQKPEIPASQAESSKMPSQDQQYAQPDVVCCTENPSDQKEDLVSGIQHQKADMLSSSAESFSVPVPNQNNAQTDDVFSTENPTVGTLYEDSVLSSNLEVKMAKSDITFTREMVALDCSDGIVHSSADTMSTKVCETPICSTTTCIDQDEDHSLSIDDTNESCAPGDTDLSLAELSSIPGSCMNSQFPLVKKDTDITVKKADNELLARDITEAYIPVVSLNVEKQDVNCERNTLITSSSASQSADAEQNKVLVPKILHQQPDIPSSSAESSNMALQDQHNAQSDAVCGTENPSVGILDDDSVLSRCFEVQTKQGYSAFTRETMAVDCSDATAQSAADATSLKSLEITLCDTTMPFSQDEEHSLSITDTSESCAPEDFASAKQTSILVYESQHAAEQVVSAHEINIEHCSQQTPVPLESYSAPRDHLSKANMNRQFILVEKDTDIVVENPNYELLDRDIPETNIPVECINEDLKAESSNMSLQDQQDMQPGAVCCAEDLSVGTLGDQSALSSTFEIQAEQIEALSEEVVCEHLDLGDKDYHNALSDAVCYAESPSVGTRDNDSVLSSRCEVQTAQSDIAFTREVTAVDCSDGTVHSAADAKSIESSEIPLCDTTMPFSQDEEYNLSIIDTSESGAPEDFASANQVSIPVYASQHAAEQVVSFQEVNNEHFSHQTPMPLASSSEERDHMSEVNMNRQFTLAEKDTDSVVENPDYELLDKNIPETNILVECINEELYAKSSDMSLQDQQDAQPGVVCCAEDLSVGTLGDESALSSTFEIQAEQTEALSDKDYHNAQSDAVCYTENSSVGTRDADTVLSSRCEVQTAQSDIAFTREVTAVDCSDATAHSAADSKSIESPEIPLCDTTMPFSQDEEYSLSIIDTSESGAPEDFASAHQVSIPVHASQHAAEQVVLFQEANSKHLSHQTPVPLASSSNERDPVSEVNMNRQFTSAEKDTDIVVENPDYELLDRNIPETNIPVECINEELNSESSNMSLQDQQDTQPGVVCCAEDLSLGTLGDQSALSSTFEIQAEQTEALSEEVVCEHLDLGDKDYHNALSDAVCYAESPSVGTRDDDSVLSSRCEVQTAQSDIAFTREVTAIDCSDGTVHSAADAKSIESSEIPLCDTTMPFSQDEEHSLSIIDTSESDAPEDFASANQVSIPVYASQHAAEQVVSFQEVNNEHFSHQTPMPLASSSEERDHMSEVNMNRQFTLAEKDTDSMVENPDYELLDRNIPETNIPAECLNDKLEAESSNISLLDQQDKKPGVVCCAKDLSVGTLGVDSALSSSSEVQAEQTEVFSEEVVREHLKLGDNVHHDAQSDTICSTENHSVRTMDDDSVLSSRCEVQTAQSDIAFTREVTAVDCSDGTVHSAADAKSIESSEIPLCDTTMPFSQDEEHSLSIIDASESCAPEDFVSADQVSIPVYASQHAAKQGVSFQEVNSEHFSHQTPVPLASSSKERDCVSEVNMNRQIKLAEKDTDSVVENPDYELLDRNIPETNIPVECINEELNAKSSNMSLQDQQDMQPGLVCCAEDLSVGKIGGDSALSSSSEVQSEQIEALSEEVVREHLYLEDKGIDNSLIPATLELNDPKTEHYEDCSTLMVLEEHDLQVAQHQSVSELLTAELTKVHQAVSSQPKVPQVLELNTASHLEPGGTDHQKLGSLRSRRSPDRVLEQTHSDQTERPLQKANMEQNETSIGEPLVLEVQKEEPAEQMESPFQFSTGAEIKDKDEPEHPSSSQSEVIRNPLEVSICQLQDTLTGPIQSPTVRLHNVHTDSTEINDAVIFNGNQGALETTSTQIHNIEGGQEEMSEEISVVDTAIVVQSSELPELTGVLSFEQQKRKANIVPNSAESKLDAVNMSEIEETEFREICGIPGALEEDLIATGEHIDRPTERISSEEHNSCLQDMDNTNNLQNTVTENIERIEPPLSLNEEMTSNNDKRNSCERKKSEEVTDSEIDIHDTAAGNRGIPLYNKTPDKHSPEPEDSSHMESANRFSAEPVHQESNSYGGEVYQQKACEDSEHVEVTFCATRDSEHQVLEMDVKSEADVKFVQPNIDSEESLEDSMSERTVVSVSFGSEVTCEQQSAGIGHEQPEGEQRSHNDGKTIAVTHAVTMEVEGLLVGDNAEKALDCPVSHQDIPNVCVQDEELVNTNKHQIHQLEADIVKMSELNEDEILELEMISDIQTQLSTTAKTAEEYLAEADRFKKSTIQMSEMEHSEYVDTIEHVFTGDTCRSPDTDSAYASPTRPTYLHTTSIIGQMVVNTEETNLPLHDNIQQNSECLITSGSGENLFQKEEGENLQPDVAGIVNDEYAPLISSVDHSGEDLPEDETREDRRNQIEIQLSMEEKDDNKGEITNDNLRCQEEGFGHQLEESNYSGDENTPNQLPPLMGMKMYKDLLEVITNDGSESVDSGLQLQDHLPSDDSKHDAIKEWLMVQASPVLDTSSSVWSDGSNTSSCRELIDACQGEECLEIDVPCCMEASVDDGQDIGKFAPAESFILNPSAGGCGAFDSLYKSDRFPTGDRKGEFASFRLHSSMEDEETRNPELVSSNYDERKLTKALRGCQESLSSAYIKNEPSYADATARKEVSDRLVGHLAPQFSASFRRCSSTGDIETERETEYSALASWSEDEYAGGRRHYAYDQYGGGYDDDSSSMDSLEEQTYPAASAMRHRSPSSGCTTSGAAGQLRQCSRGDTRHCSLYDEYQDMLEEFYANASLVSLESATATTSTSYASALEDLPSDDVEQMMTDSLEELTAEDIGAAYPDILYPPSSRSSISQDSLNDIDDISSTYGGGEEICETSSSFTDDSIEDAYDTDEGGPRVIYGTQLEQTLFEADITPTVELAAPFPASLTTPTTSQGSKDSQCSSHPEQSPSLPADLGKDVS